MLDEHGRVAEAGTHERLLAARGLYADFWEKRLASSRWKLV